MGELSAQAWLFFLLPGPVMTQLSGVGVGRSGGAVGLVEPKVLCRSRTTSLAKRLVLGYQAPAPLTIKQFYLTLSVVVFPL